MARRCRDRLQWSSPTWLILDLQTPDERGLAALRTHPSGRSILPGDRDDQSTTIDTAIDAIKGGASDYLAKPLDAARLRDALTTVRAIVERRERTQELSSSG